jgi:hypothetical protein
MLLSGRLISGGKTRAYKVEVMTAAFGSAMALAPAQPRRPCEPSRKEPRQAQALAPALEHVPGQTTWGLAGGQTLRLGLGKTLETRTLQAPCASAFI